MISVHITTRTTRRRTLMLSEPVPLSSNGLVLRVLHVFFSLGDDEVPFALCWIMYESNELHSRNFFQKFLIDRYSFWEKKKQCLNNE